jgi:hypothetical protein
MHGETHHFLLEGKLIALERKIKPHKSYAATSMRV